MHWMSYKPTPARPTTGTPGDSFRTRGVREAWKKAPEAPRFPFQARRVPAGRAPPKTHLCRRFLGLRLGQEAEPSSGGRPGRRSLGSCFLGVPHHFPSLGRRPDARALELATGTRAQRRRRSAELEIQRLSSSHFRLLTGKARGDAINSREIYPKGPA